MIKILTRYSKHDPKFMGDYREIEVYINRAKVAQWGDDYHDKGWEKANAWVQGYCYANNISFNKNVVLDRVADLDYF